MILIYISSFIFDSTKSPEDVKNHTKTCKAKDTKNRKEMEIKNWIFKVKLLLNDFNKSFRNFSLRVVYQPTFHTSVK